LVKAKQILNKKVKFFILKDFKFRNLKLFCFFNS